MPTGLDIVPGAGGGVDVWGPENYYHVNFLTTGIRDKIMAYFIENLLNPLC